jgi:hypothetical protein
MKKESRAKRGCAFRRCRRRRGRTECTFAGCASGFGNRDGDEDMDDRQQHGVDPIHPDAVAGVAVWAGNFQHRKEEETGMGGRQQSRGAGANVIPHPHADPNGIGFANARPLDKHSRGKDPAYPYPHHLSDVQPVLR